MNVRNFFPMDADGGGGGAALAPDPATAAPVADAGAGGAGAPSAQPAPGGASPGAGSLLARGAGTPASGASPAKPDAGSDAEPAAIPEKYVVKNEDGTVNYEASALKQAQGYQALAKRLGAGDAPPAKPEDYAPSIPDGLTLDSLKNDPLYQGFLKGAHSRGMTNAHVSYVLEAMAQRMRPDPAVAEAELRKVWATDDELTKNLSGAYRAVQTYAGGEEAMQRLEAKFGSDPDFIKLMARIAPELGEDPGINTGITPAEQDTLESILSHPGYLDSKHPEHGKLVAKARGLYAKKHGPQ